MLPNKSDTKFMFKNVANKYTIVGKVLFSNFLNYCVKCYLQIKTELVKSEAILYNKPAQLFQDVYLFFLKNKTVV